ncbi:CooT family nickel-binding protein [Trichloromonas sp.]|uniref:CooT family nickel-binding protein n=1 Tax=Trichloromonas sp. TaxID=3069249 RepID=UPI003D8138DA
MCLDNGTFLLINNDEEISLEHVASILPTGGGLKLVDVFGKSREISGSISEIDLLNKRIVIG